MQEYMTIGSTPYSEECAQVGAPDYPEKSRLECRVFMGQLLRVCGKPPAGASVKVKSFPHDFGTYREVVVVYDDSNEKAEEYALKLEDHGIEYWDEQAKKELAGEPAPVTVTVKPNSTVASVLMRRDGMDVESANKQVENARERVANGENPEEILEGEFGLEPDYIFDILL